MTICQANKKFKHKIEVIDNILSCEHYQEPYSGKNHWNLVRSLSEETKATRKLVSDIQHVALTMEHGCT